MLGLWMRGLVNGVVALIVCVLFCLNQSAISDLSASATLTFSEGGYAIPLMDEMKEKQILVRAIERAGLADELTPTQLARMLSFEPASSRPAKEAYVSMEVIVRLRMDARWDSVRPEALLSSYLDAVMQRDGDALALVELDWQTMERMDYFDAIDALRLKATLLADSLGESEVEALLKRRIEDYLNASLYGYEAFVLHHGLTRSSDAFAARLETQNRALQRELQYFNDLGGANTQEILKAREELMRNEERLASLKQPQAGSQMDRRAEEDLRALWEALCALEDEARSASEVDATADLRYEVHSPSLVERFAVKRGLLLAVGTFCGLGLLEACFPRARRRKGGARHA
jgi:hypothetical protein